MLRRAGAQVTLVDAWGPGHARASSGGETRIIRGTYGDRAIYTTDGGAGDAVVEGTRRPSRRASNAPFFIRNGAIWMFSGDESFGEASLEPMKAAGLPVEWLDPAQAKARWPHVSFEGVTKVLWEPEAGYALARRACEHVVETLVAEGGRYIVGQVSTRQADGRAARGARARRAGRRCRPIASCSRAVRGSARCCPDVVGSRIRPSRQESFYFGTPAGDAALAARRRCRCGSTTAPPVLRHSRQRQSRLQGGRRHVRTRPSIPPTAIARTRRRCWPRRAPSCACGSRRSPMRRCSAPKCASTSSRPTRTSSIDRHPAAANVVARRRRLRARLQDGAGARRVRRQARAATRSNPRPRSGWAIAHDAAPRAHLSVLLWVVLGAGWRRRRWRPG